MKPIGMKKIAI